MRSLNLPLDSQHITTDRLNLGLTLLDRWLLTQLLQTFVHIQMAERDSSFGLHIALGIILGNGQPGGIACGETTVLAICPLHGRSGGITRIGHIELFVAIASLRIDSLLPRNIRIQHAQLLTLIGDTTARQCEQQNIEEINAIGTKARTHTILIVITNLFVRQPTKIPISYVTTWIRNPTLTTQLALLPLGICDSQLLIRYS